jgi:hypothetical protein
MLIRDCYEQYEDTYMKPVIVPDTEYVAGYVMDMEKFVEYGYDPDTAPYEYYESFFIVDFIPTSENLSKWVYELTTPKMAKLGVKVGEVEWWETPKSCSRYSG